MLFGHIQKDQYQNEAILWLNEPGAIKAFQEHNKDILDHYQNISEYDTSIFSKEVPFDIDIFSEEEVKSTDIYSPGETYQYVYYSEFAGSKYSQPFGNTGLWILFVPHIHRIDGEDGYDIYNKDSKDHYTYYLFDERGVGVQGSEPLGLFIGEFDSLNTDTPEWTFDGDKGTIQVTVYDGHNGANRVCSSIFSIQAILDKTFPISDCEFWKNHWEMNDTLYESIDSLLYKNTSSNS